MDKKQRSQNVVFRRVRGRIVPIKVSAQRRKDAAIGGSLLAAGAAVGVSAGRAQKSYLAQAEKFASRASDLADMFRRVAKANSNRPKIIRGQMSFSDLGFSGFERSKASLIKKAAVDAAKSAKEFNAKASLAFKLRGVAVGLATVGAYKLGQAIEKKDKDAGVTFKVASPAIGGLVGIGSYGLASSLLSKRQVLKAGFKVARSMGLGRF